MEPSELVDALDGSLLRLPAHLGLRGLMFAVEMPERSESELCCSTAATALPARVAVGV